MKKPAEQSPGLDYKKSLCVGRTSFTKIQEQPYKILPLFSSFTFLKDEERKKFFFSGFEITQPPKNGSEQKKKKLRRGSQEASASWRVY